MRAFVLFASLCLALAPAACRNPRPIRGEEGSPKAVVLAGTEKDADSERIAKALQDRGYDVVRKSTPLSRTHSSMAIYDVRNHPERVDDLNALLHEELGIEVEVLPFLQHAGGGNAVVVWLGRE